MIIRLTNTIGAIGRRLGIVTKNLQMWLGFYKSEIIGKELVVDGDFPTGTTAWIFDAAQWSVSNNKAYGSGVSGLIQNSNSLIVGANYTVTFNLDDYTSGSVKIYSGSGSDDVEYYSSEDSHSFSFIANSSSIYAYSNSFIGSISNISIKEVTQFVKDKSTNSNDAKLFTGKALSFDGINDYVDFGSDINNDGTVWTVAIWLSDYFTNTYSWLLGGNVTNRSIGLRYAVAGADFGKVFFRDSSAVYNAFDYNGYEDSSTESKRLVFVSNGTSVSLYVNGVFIDSVTPTTTQLRVERLMAGYNTSSFFVKANASDFQLYNSAWTVSDVAFDYNNPNHLVTDNPNTTLTLSNLSAYYALSEGSGSKIYDSTGLGAELVENGDFATDSDWTTSSPTLPNSIVFNANDSVTLTSVDSNVYISQANVFNVGDSYSITYTITSSSSDTNVLKLASSLGVLVIPTSVGTHTVTGVAVSSTLYIERYSNGVDATISNFSVKEVKADDGTSYDGAAIGATWVDQQPTIPQLGLMDWSKGNNLIPFSEDFSEFTNNNSTTSLNTLSSPLGDTTADTIISNTSSTFSGVYEGVNSISAGDYTFSVWLKSSNITALSLRLRADSTQLAVENITITSDWVRYSITATAPITSVFQTHVFLNADGISGTSNVGDEVYIWGAQLEQSSTVGSYIGTNGLAASNAILVQNPNDLGKDVLGNSLRLRERGFNLDGTGYAEVADDDSLDFGTGDFTIETWVKADYISGGSSLNVAFALGGDVDASDSTGISTHGASSKIVGYVGGSSLTANDSYNIGNWYHIVITRDSDLCTMYVDNNSQAITKTNTNSIANNSINQVGRDSNGNRFYSETVDEVRLYNRALTLKEITNNYKVGLNAHKVGSAFSTEFSSEFGF